MWDRRTLHQDNPVEVGALAGHTDGITYIDSKVRHTIHPLVDSKIQLDHINLLGYLTQKIIRYFGVNCIKSNV